MNIVVDGFGTFLAKKGKRIVIKQKGNNKEFAIYKIDSLLIECRGVSLSSDLIKELRNETINIVFCDNEKPIAFVSYIDKNPLLTKELLLLSDEHKARISKELIINKMNGQFNVLVGLKKSGLLADIVETEKTFEEIKQKVLEIKDGFEEARNKLFALEAEFAQNYWHSLSMAIPPEYSFTKREKMGARDALNSSLNYGYAILSSKVLGFCLKAKLDPTVGILHSTRADRSSLVYDLMEPYRPLVDRAIITLFTKKMFDLETDFDLQQFRLTKSGKEKVIERTTRAFSKFVDIKGNRQAAEKAILYTCYNLRDFLLKKNNYFYVVVPS